MSKELVIDNALSQFQAEERDRAAARLGAMFDESEELLDDEDLPSRAQWYDLASAPADEGVPADADLNYPAAVAVMKRAAELKGSVGAEDADDIESLCERLKQAMASGDGVTVTSLTEELDDILFYVR